MLIMHKNPTGIFKLMHFMRVLCFVYTVIYMHWHIVRERFKLSFSRNRRSVTFPKQCIVQTTDVCIRHILSCQNQIVTCIFHIWEQF